MRAALGQEVSKSRQQTRAHESKLEGMAVW